MSYHQNTKTVAQAAIIIPDAFPASWADALPWFAATAATNKFTALHFSGYVRKGVEAMLPLPKWQNSAVRFGQLPPWKYPRRSPDQTYNVSAASVVRSRIRADRAARRAEEVRRAEEMKPVWQAPAVEPVDFLDQWEMFSDEELQDETLIDDEEVDETMFGPTVASQRRVYNKQELAEIARASGVFSQIKYDAGPFWSSKAGFLEEHVAYHWRYIDPQTIPVPTESDLTAAFSRTLYWAAEVNKKIKRLCNGKAKACRAYQAAAVIRDYYLYGLRISAMDMIYASRVIEAISEHLRRDGRIDWTSRTAILDMLEGASDRAAAEKFGLHHKSLQERYATETTSIEAKFGRYCNEIWQPRQKRPTSWYTGGKSRKLAPLHDLLLSPAERAKLVDDYLYKSRGRITVRHLEDEWRVWWLRDVYFRIATYLEDGGRILTGYGAVVEGLPGFIIDSRSDEQVQEKAGFAGSRPSELFATKPRRPNPNIEYDVDAGLRHGLAEAVPSIEDDDAPISDTREQDQDPLFE